MEFGENYWSGREKHLKRPKIRLVLLLLRVKAPFPPPKPPKSPNFTTFHQNGWDLAKLCGIQWINHSGAKSCPTEPEPCKKAYVLLSFSASGTNGCFRVVFTWNSHFSMKIMNFTFSWKSMNSVDFTCGSGTSVCGAKRHIKSYSFLSIPDDTFAGNSWIPWFPHFHIKSSISIKFMILMEFHGIHAFPPRAHPPGLWNG